MCQNSLASKTRFLANNSFFKITFTSWYVYTVVGLCIIHGSCSTVSCHLRQCSSEEYEFKECKLSEDKFIINVTVTILISDRNCTYLETTRDAYNGSIGTYGYHGSTLWVDNGCRAYFNYCLADGTYTPTPPSSREAHVTAETNLSSTTISQSTLSTVSEYTVTSPESSTSTTGASSITVFLNESMSSTQSTSSFAEDMPSTQSSSSVSSTGEMSTTSTEIPDNVTSSNMSITTSSGTVTETRTVKQSETSDTDSVVYIVVVLVVIVVIVLVGGALGWCLWNKRYKDKKCPVEHEDSGQEWKTRNIIDFINQIPNKPPSLVDDGNWSLQQKTCINNPNEPQTAKTAENNIIVDKEEKKNNSRPLPKPCTSGESHKNLHPLPNPCPSGKDRNNDTGMSELFDDYLTPLSKQHNAGDDAIYAEIIETERTGDTLTELHSQGLQKHDTKDLAIGQDSRYIELTHV